MYVIKANMVLAMLYSQKKSYQGNTDTHLTFPQKYNRLPKYLRTLYSLLNLKVHLAVGTKALQPHESKYVMARTLLWPIL